MKVTTSAVCTSIRLGIATALLSLSVAAAASAQTAGTIEGSVVDANGQPAARRRGDGERSRRAPGTRDRRRRRLHGHRPDKYRERYDARQVIDDQRPDLIDVDDLPDHLVKQIAQALRERDCHAGRVRFSCAEAIGPSATGRTDR